MEISLNIESYGLALSDDDPVGDDPRYLDEFDLIRTEIEKMSGCDFNLIESRARFILLEKSKDLRVAGYLILALTYLKGLHGLIEGLSIYNELLASFGAALHPIRPIAKASAIKWLNNAKLESFVKKEIISDEKTLINLKQLTSKLNELITKFFPEVQSSFFILNSWLLSQQIEKGPPPSKSMSFMDKILPSAPKEKQINGPLEDQKDYEQTCRRLFSYFKENVMRTELVNIARMMRWSNTFKIPEHKNYQTQIPMIRKECVAELNELLETGEPGLLFNKVEAAFLEIGGQYFLDLQYYSYCALKNLSDKKALSMLEFHMRNLLESYPLLVSLSFSDGTAFAGESTKQWLSGLKHSSTVVKSESVVSSNIRHDFLNQAKQLSSSTDLLSIMNHLKKLPANSPRETIEKSYAIAQLLSGKKKDLAYYQYQTLIEQIKEQHLELWLPELAIEIFVSYRNFLVTMKGRETELKKVTQWLCHLDPITCF